MREPAHRPEPAPAAAPPATPAELLARDANEARRVFRACGPPPARGWRVAAIGAETLPPGAYAAWRDFPYHVIEYIESGRGSAEAGGVARALAPGHVHAVAPDTRRAIRADARRPLRRRYLWLDGPGAAAALAQAGLGDPRPRLAPAPGEIRETWDWLLRDGAPPGRRGDELARALAEVLLLKLADARPAEELPREGSRASFERCRALADTEAARLRGAAELARAAGLRVETVCRLFRAHLDTTPGAYLRARRARLAAELLLAPGARVKEVAASLGFADAFHFSKVFKAELGLSPRAWIASRRS